MTSISNPRFAGNELVYVMETLERGMKPGPGGTMKERLERAFAERFRVPYAVSSNSGTSPLHQALMACGVRPGDEVIVPALGPMMPAFAVMHAGAIPVFADVCEDTFLIDPEDIRRKMTQKTSAILVVHLYGGVCDMGAITTLAHSHTLSVIEDCAQCVLGSDELGQLAGTIGDAGTFSFDNKKHLSSGEGGMLITSNGNVAKHARRFGGLGFSSITATTGNVARDLASFQNPDYERHATFGFNYRMCEVAAAVALAQTERMDEFVENAMLMGAEFHSVLRDIGCDWIVPQKVHEKSVSSYWTFAARYDGEERFGVTWVEFRKKFMEFGGDGIYAAWKLPYQEPALLLADERGDAFPTLSEQLLAYKGAFRHTSCPVAERLQSKMLQFTTNQRTQKERTAQAEALRKTIAWVIDR